MPRTAPLEPFKIKVIEPMHCPDRQEREEALRTAAYNLFTLPSSKVFIDLLTDSGTSAMSQDQWAGMMMGDETYAGSVNFQHLEKTVQDIFGFEHVIPTHQGRAAEHILFSTLVKPGQVVPNNTHFDTTRANVAYRDAEPLDCPSPEALDTEREHLFKGNLDPEKLEKALNDHGPANVPLILVTVTNNAVGGQPVSMKNIREVAAIARRAGVPFFIDACRYAENSYFIKEREPGYKNKSLPAIAKEMFSYADGCYMSAKKDALVNIGGFLAVRDEKLARKLKHLLILMEGFPTYGGLARRDLEAMSRGLKEGLDYDYLHHRVGQVRYLGSLLRQAHVPLVMPTGGHAVYVDARRFLPHIPSEYFPAQALTCALYREGGVRGCELGSVTFAGHGDPAMLELVRLAIPRRVYTCCHLEYVADVVARVYAQRKKIKGLRMIESAEFLRHFTAKFEEVPNHGVRNKTKARVLSQAL